MVLHYHILSGVFMGLLYNFLAEQLSVMRSWLCFIGDVAAIPWDDL